MRKYSFLLLTLGLVSLWNPIDATTASRVFAKSPQNSNFTINIAQPADGAIAGSDLVVGVIISSTFEIQGVTASVEGRNAVLSYSSIANVCDKFGTCKPGWRGQISMAGLARGQKTLTVNVTDVQNGSAQAQRDFIYDQAPKLTINAPLNETVARPTLDVSATCSDDDPAGCTSLTVSVNGNTIAIGSSTITANISLSAYDGKRIVLRFLAKDSRGQITLKERLVFVESSNKLAEVVSVSGRILDVLVDRILFVETTEDANALKILNRATGAETVVLNDPTKVTKYGYLSPLGAIFVTQTGNSFSLIESRDATLIQLGSVNEPNTNTLPFALKVKGDYAIWNLYGGDWSGDVIILRNLAAGSNSQVTNTAAIGWHDVTASGEVAFWSKPMPVYYNSNVYIYSGGGLTQLTDDADVQNYAPLSDGFQTAYLKNGAIILHSSAGDTVLAPTGRYPAAQVGLDYQVNGAWTAFTRIGNGDATQVWVRTPEGVEIQRGHFTGGSYLKGLNSQGEVGFTSAGRLYLARFNEPLLDLASDLGFLFFQNGHWHLTIGRSLFQVTNSTPPAPLLLNAAHSSQALALDSVTSVAGSFSLANQNNFSADQRTRITLFTTNINSLADGSFPAISVQLEDEQHRFFTVPAEYVGRVPKFDWLTQVNVRLPDELLNAGDVRVTVNVAGSVTNQGLIKVKPSGTSSP